MPLMTQEPLFERLSKGGAACVLLLGDEAYLRDDARAQLVQRFVPDAARAWAVSRYSAEREETQRALEQAQTLPMLSPRQIIFIEDAEQIDELAEKGREAVIEALEGYFDNPAPFTILVLEASKLDKRMSLAKLLAENALVLDVGLGEEPGERLAAAIAVALSLAKKQGLQFENGAAEELAECVAADLLRLKTEIEKLATHVSPGKLIRRQDVSSLVIAEKATTVWELADLLAARQQKRAMEFLDRLLRSGEAPLQMLGALIWSYRKIIEASELRGVKNGYQAARFLGMRPEQAELALQSSRKTSKPRLLRGLKALQQADDLLKRGGENTRTVMEFLVAELTAKEARAAHN